MKLSFPWKKIVRWSALTLLGMLLALATWVPIQQQILRWRAERLLANIRAIQMGKSNWDDAQRLMHRWGAWNEQLDNCTEKSCLFRISIDDSSHAFQKFPVLYGGNWGTHLRWPRWLSKVYFALGGRFAVVVAQLSVENGLIQAKSFGMLTALSPNILNQRKIEDFGPDSAVMARTICDSQLSPWGYISHNSPEVTYFASDNDHDGHGGYIQFTPFTERAQIDSLFDFNLNCLTRFNECKISRELLPSLTKLYATNSDTIRRINAKSAIVNLPIWIIARDAEYVAIGETRNIPKDAHPLQSNLPMEFRIKHLLKGSEQINSSISLLETITTEGSSNLCLIPSEQARQMKQGTGVLMAFDGPLNLDSDQTSDSYLCFIFPLNSQTLSEAKRGIERGK